MSKANQIVNRLLEDNEAQDSSTDPLAGVDPTAYLDTIAKDRESGKLTVYNADEFSTFYHRTETYSDGVTPIQVRRSGSTKRWKTRPREFRIPVKYGLKQSFYIDQNNADNWSTVPLPPKGPKPKRKTVKKARPAAPPERPDPVSTMSPGQWQDWERERIDRYRDLPLPPPPDHPELPL